MGVPKDETQTAIANMEEGRMGYLFENMEKMDIQEERRKTMLASERADKAERRADKAEQMLFSIAKTVITQAKETHHTKEETIQLLKDQYHLDELAEELMEKLW